MSYIQLISKRTNGSYYNVHFGDTIKFKQDSKVAMVSLDVMVVYNVDFFTLLSLFPNRTMKMIFYIGERPDNSIEIPIKITDSDFVGIDIRAVKFDELLSILNTQIYVKFLEQYVDGEPESSGYPAYYIKLEQTSDFEGGLAVQLIGTISRKENLNSNIYEYKPHWDDDETENFDAVGDNEISPKSAGITTSVLPAYVYTDQYDGIDINGGYCRFLINGEQKKWTFFMTNEDLDFTSTDVFDIDDTDKDLIYCPVQIKSLGVAEGEMIHIIKHSGAEEYSTNPADADNNVLYRLHDIADGDMFEIYINIDASILIRHTRNDGDINDYEIDNINQEFLYPFDIDGVIDYDDGDIKIGLYTTVPNMKPIKELYYTVNNAKSIDLSNFQFVWQTGGDTKEDNFAKVRFEPTDFASFLGFSSNYRVDLYPSRHGDFSTKSDTNVSANVEGSLELLNIHLVNLPITSYKNTATTTLTNGFTTTLIGSMPLIEYGKNHFAPKHLLYMDLKNPEETINEIQVEIRDAITNKTTQLLSGTTILTLHLI